MSHFEKLQESSIMANKVVETFCFSFFFFSSSSSVLQPSYLTTAVPTARQCFSSLALAAQTRKWHTVQAGKAQTQVLKWRKLLRTERKQWPLNVKINGLDIRQFLGCCMQLIDPIISNTIVDISYSSFKEHIYLLYHHRNKVFSPQPLLIKEV